MKLGLTPQQVEESIAAHGTNELTPPQRPSMWKLYMEKFHDPVIRILLVAALLSFIVAFIENEFAETIGIVCAILLATGIGFFFEYDAAKKFDALNALGGEYTVKTVRNGVVIEVQRKDLVVGDVIILDTGDEIPADALLLTAESLQVNESSLTGEPVTHKSTNLAEAEPNAPYPVNKIMRGTTIVEGSAVAQIVAVGDHTEIGNVAREATLLTGEKTPLNKQLDKLADLINKVGYTVAVLTFIIFTTHELFMYVPTITAWHHAEMLHVFKLVLDNFMMAVTLIVMAVPEGLPMAVTLSLALNMRRMLKTNNLVRKMHACETMGAITVICTDKTGTLTQNKMTVSEMNQVEHDETILAQAIACNSTAFLNDNRTDGLGNPTEVALLLWLQSQGIDYQNVRNNSKEVGRLPFSSERKYMATLIENNEHGGKILLIKGAPEVIMSLCSNMSAEKKVELEEKLKNWQNHAQRTLLLAYKHIENGEILEDIAEVVRRGGLQLIATTAISDPVRVEVPAAVKSCLNAGINVKIVTGDSTGTAVEIARQIGLWNETDDEQNAIKGVEFEALTDEEALARIKSLKVMSRARPLDKQRLVKLLQRQNEVVAVTGDGTNDAPALNFAQVGLSMGSGTSVAKEASDITLLDDSFRSIVTAVMWGRSLYKNIQRFVMFQLTINVTALLIVLIGSFIGTTLPLTVTQMLWVNIIMDTFAAMALASLPADPKVMNDQPRPVHQFIITPAMWKSILGFGLSFVAVLLAMLLHALKGETIDSRELTLFFTFFVFLQFWNLLNAKCFGTNRSAFSNLKDCKSMLCVLFFIGIGQWLIVEYGGAVFRTTPLSSYDWMGVILCSSVVLWIGEIIRAIKRLKQKV